MILHRLYLKRSAMTAAVTWHGAGIQNYLKMDGTSETMWLG